MVTSTDRIRLLKTIFGGGSLDVRGSNLAVECPACGKTGKRKLSIHLESGKSHCWVCGVRSKRVSSIIYKYISREAAGEYRVKCEGGDPNDVVDEGEEGAATVEKLVLPDNFIPVYSRAALSDPDARHAARYLIQRGLSADDIARFRIGVSPAIRRRVVIPSFDAEGKVNFYTARALDPDVKFRYANCQVKKTDIIFNEINIDWSQELVLVEGPFDLMKCPDNATCLLGSSLGAGHLLFQKIVTHRTPVVLALDADMRQKTQKIAEMLFSYDCDVRIADVGSDGRDIGDLTHIEACNMINRAVQWKTFDRLLFSISNIRSGSTL